jgi:hypothetical protein
MAIGFRRALADFGVGGGPVEFAELGEREGQPAVEA